MSRFRFELAGPADDAALRALLRENPMEGGRLRVGFEREPSFFGAARVGSEDVQVGVAREAGGAIVGLGTRALRRAWVNGDLSARVGYLGDLRLAPAFRGGTLVARGYRFLRELHRDGRADVYHTVVFADNAPALATLAAAGGRAGLPVYEDLGRLCCPGLRLHGRGPRGGPDPADVTVGRGRPEELPEIMACLNRFGARRQFAPVHAAADFAAGAGRWPGFGAGDFFVARRGGTVVGVAGAWDQRAFKQTRVHALGGSLRWLAPLANALRPLAPRRVPPFPRPGETLPFLYASFLGVDGDDPAVLRALLRAMRRAFAGGAFLYLLVGLHERDPLLPALAGFAQFPFVGRLFRVRLDDGGPVLDGRVPYVEAATL